MNLKQSCDRLTRLIQLLIILLKLTENGIHCLDSSTPMLLNFTSYKIINRNFDIGCENDSIFYFESHKNWSRIYFDNENPNWMQRRLIAIDNENRRLYLRLLDISNFQEILIMVLFAVNYKFTDNIINFYFLGI